MTDNEPRGSDTEAELNLERGMRETFKIALRAALRHFDELGYIPAHVVSCIKWGLDKYGEEEEDEQRTPSQ
jgi:hypothetical protein